MQTPPLQLLRTNQIQTSSWVSLVENQFPSSTAGLARKQPCTSSHTSARCPAHVFVARSAAHSAARAGGGRCSCQRPPEKRGENECEGLDKLTFGDPRS